MASKELLWSQLLARAAVVLLFPLAWFAQGGSLPNIPGYQDIGWGFDVITGAKPSGLTGPIIKFTLNQSKTFSCPQDSSLVWQVPDQLNVQDGAELDVASTTTVSYSSHELAGYISGGVELSGGMSLPDVSFSASANVKAAAGFLAQRNTYSSYTHTTQFGVVYLAGLLPGSFELDESFLEALHALPAEYNSSSKAQFQTFLQSYGTHLLARGYYGGYADMSVAVNAYSAQAKGGAWLSTQASAHFNFLISGGTGGGGADAAQDFLGSGNYQSSFSQKWVGGNPNFEGTNLTLWREWVNSYYQYPVLVFKDTKPLYLMSYLDLIPDNLHSVRDNIQQAVGDYYSSNTFPADPACMGNYLTGNGACCVQSGQTASCDSYADTCYDPSQSMCCSTYVAPLGSACCGATYCEGGTNFECCSNSFCCQKGDTCCGTYCCPDGGVCCQGGCCDRGTTCCFSGGYCCVFGCCYTVFTGNFCCLFAQEQLNASALVV